MVSAAAFLVFSVVFWPSNIPRHNKLIIPLLLRVGHFRDVSRQRFLLQLWQVKLYGAIRGMCHEIKILQLFEQGTNVTRYRTDQTRGVYMRLFVYVQQILGIFRQAIHKKLIWSCNWCLFVTCIESRSLSLKHILVLVIGLLFHFFLWTMLTWVNKIQE